MGQGWMLWPDGDSGAVREVGAKGGQWGQTETLEPEGEVGAKEGAWGGALDLCCSRQEQRGEHMGGSRGGSRGGEYSRKRWNSKAFWASLCLRKARTAPTTTNTRTTAAATIAPSAKMLRPAAARQNHRAPESQNLRCSDQAVQDLKKPFRAKKSKGIPCRCWKRAVRRSGDRVEGGTQLRSGHRTQRGAQPCVSVRKAG